MVCEMIHIDLDKLKTLQTPFQKALQKDIDNQIGEKSFLPLTAGTNYFQVYPGTCL